MLSCEMIDLLVVDNFSNICYVKIFRLLCPNRIPAHNTEHDWFQIVVVPLMKGGSLTYF